MLTLLIYINYIKENKKGNKHWDLQLYKPKY